MAYHDSTNVLGSATVRELVDPGMRQLPGSDSVSRDFFTGTVKPFESIERLHQKLVTLGFQLHQKELFGPQYGEQLFYVKDTTHSESGKWFLDGVLVRIKTKGNRTPPRKDVAHMSVCLYRRGLGWSNEKRKFDVHGDKTSKTPPKSLTPAEKDEWAHACHFNFPHDFDFTNVWTLHPGNYAIRDALWKGLK